MAFSDFDYEAFGQAWQYDFCVAQLFMAGGRRTSFLGICLAGSRRDGFLYQRFHCFGQDDLLQAADGMLEDLLLSANIVSKPHWHIRTQRQQSGNAASLDTPSAN